MMQHDTADKREVEKAFSVLKEKHGRIVHPEYRSVQTVDEAVQLLGKYGQQARIFAGGLDILGQMKNDIISPLMLINIKPIEKLKLMSIGADDLSVGALVKITEIEHSPVVKNNIPMLAETAAAIGSPHIRNMATLAGNLCQQTRCWYYRRSPETGLSFNCRRKSASSPCYAVDGENQYHAVAEYERCVSVCPSDMAVALSALDAKATLVGGSGIRELPVSQLYRDLGQTFEPNEIMTAIHIPTPEKRSKQKFIKFRVRKSIDFAIVSVAISIQSERGVICNAKVYLGGISHRPYRAIDAEKVLMGEKLSPALAQHAGEQAVFKMKPLSKNAYKLAIARAIVKRALLET